MRKEVSEKSISFRLISWILIILDVHTIEDGVKLKHR